jgi:hypothetical protein
MTITNLTVDHKTPRALQNGRRLSSGKRRTATWDPHNTPRVQFRVPHHLICVDAATSRTTFAGPSDTETCLLPTTGTEWIWESWNDLPAPSVRPSVRLPAWGRLVFRSLLHSNIPTPGVGNWGATMSRAPRWSWTMLTKLMVNNNCETEHIENEKPLTGFWCWPWDSGTVHWDNSVSSCFASKYS